MDVLISEEIVEHLYTRLTDISSIANPDQYRAAIEGLFDSEEHLVHGIHKLVKDALDSVKSTDDIERIAVVISKSINKAALLGFLSERFMRDKVLDSNMQEGTNLFRRGYEDLETFINRRMKRKNLAEIAKEETTKDEW